MGGRGRVRARVEWLEGDAEYRDLDILAFLDETLDLSKSTLEKCKDEILLSPSPLTYLATKDFFDAWH